MKLKNDFAGMKHSIEKNHMHEFFLYHFNLPELGLRKKNALKKPMSM